MAPLLGACRRLKCLTLTLLLIVGNGMMAQSEASQALAQPERWSANNGQVAFRSDAPLELIEAQSEALRGLLAADGRFAFVLPMNSFRGFNSGLQREHFQENYLETVEYPKAVFEGRVIDPPSWPLEDEAVVRIRGMLRIHGVERERIIQVRLTPAEGGAMEAEASFSVRLDDHAIGIPKIMHQKIADTIMVQVLLTLFPDS